MIAATIATIATVESAKTTTRGLYPIAQSAKQGGRGNGPPPTSYTSRVANQG